MKRLRVLLIIGAAMVDTAFIAATFAAIWSHGEIVNRFANTAMALSFIGVVFTALACYFVSTHDA